MGVVLLLVALPALAVMALVLSVFDGLPAIGLALMIVGAVGAILREARSWDAPGAGHRGARKIP